MAKIKKISFSDIGNIKKLISVVCSDNIINYRRLFFNSVPTTFLQNLFYSVHFRKLMETYVVSDNQDNLKGLISVKSQKGNPFKWHIKRLFLAPNSHELGKQLIEYIIAKFGARGVDTFVVAVDDHNNDLIDLFIKGCGFRFCSTEALWEVSNINFVTQQIDEKNFKMFKNSDAEKVLELYTDNLVSLYKYSLEKEKDEFVDSEFIGFSKVTAFKYIYEDEQSGEIKAYLKIQTIDNTNYFLDVILPVQYSDLYSMLLSFAVKKIVRRNKNFKLYIKNRRYFQSGDEIEEFLRNNRFKHLQNNAILVRDFFKTVKQENSSFDEAVIFSGVENI